jgi:hypothetical protein
MKNENEIEIEIELTQEKAAFILKMLEEKKTATDDPAARAEMEALIEKIREETEH